MTGTTHPDRSADRLSIAELFARYAWGMDMADRDVFAGVWTATAVWTSVAAGLDLRGRETIMRYFDESLPRRPHLPAQGSALRLCGTPIIEFDDDDRAHSRCELLAVRVMPDGVSAYSAGYYLDDVLRTPQGWQFTHRDMIVSG